MNENVLESDFEPLCDGTTRRRSLTDLRLRRGCRFIIVSGSRRVLSLCCSICQHQCLELDASCNW